MKTILVPTSGTATDSAVFATALPLARAVGGHLEFLHVRLDPCEAALQDPHAHFCIGPAISATLSFHENRDRTLSAAAVSHFMDFCEQHRIPILENPIAAEGISAQWLEDTNDAEEHFLFHARHSDVTVLGRQHTTDLMPANLIETLLKRSGRPIVIAPDAPPHGLIRTVAIGWDATSECARALTVAMPLLRQAHRVVLLTARKRADESPNLTRQELNDLTQQLAWNGVAAESKILSGSDKTLAQQLTGAAREVQADLLVVGGYGHSSFREQVFGGVTHELLATADLPVFLMH